MQCATFHSVLLRLFACSFLSLYLIFYSADIFLFCIKIRTGKQYDYIERIRTVKLIYAEDPKLIGNIPSNAVNISVKLKIQQKRN